ncbi:acyltransferase family protein [Dickeya zeae]|uniref:acyltransferase family protein n=1 Tax=Dickeya zeae TaxID=204042 RepID=UPI00143FD543|nr:acyltransferase [Dickeya zeae]QIZ46007.1 acyltransferase [Dickeya zeae]
MKKREIHFDVVRIIACLAVMLFHYNVYFLYADPSSSRIGQISYFNQTVGDIAISLFIILSGVSLTISQTYSKGDLGYIDFYKRRFLGIFPSFWVSYFIVACLFILVGLKFGDGQYWKFFLSLIGLDGFFLYRMSNYYLVGEWYTGYMLITYCFFPFLKKFFDKTPLYCWMIVITIFVSLNSVYDKIFDVYINCNPIMRIPDILFGITFAKYVNGNKIREYMMMFFSVLIVFFSSELHSVIPSQMYMFIMGAALFSIVSCSLSFFKYNSLLSKSIVRISGLTFLAFLFHHQVIYAVFRFIDYRILDFQQKIVLFLFCVLVSFFLAKEVEPLVNKVTSILKTKMFKTSIV